MCSPATLTNTPRLTNHLCRDAKSRQIVLSILIVSTKSQPDLNIVAKLCVVARMTATESTHPLASDSQRRVHTGRRRNEQARLAVLQATVELLLRADAPPITMDAVAAAAGVGKQTIYRWWPSKAAVLVDALTHAARDRVPTMDSGDVHRDVTGFLEATFRAANSKAVSRALRTVMADAQHDAQAAEVLHRYTAERRSAMLALLKRGQDRGQLVDDADLGLIVDLAFGFVWYRLLIGHAPLTKTDAAKLAARLLCNDPTP